MSTPETKSEDPSHENESASDRSTSAPFRLKNSDKNEGKGKCSSNEESQLSPDISLSQQNTLRYSDVESENKSSSSSSSSSDTDSSSEADSSDSAKDNFEDAPTTQTTQPMHEQSQFKNSFYEKLSVTCQNLESTVASLQKPTQSEEAKTRADSIEERLSQNLSEFANDTSGNVSRPETLPLSQPGITTSADKRKKETGTEKPSHVPLHQNLLIDIDSESTSNKDNEAQGACYIEPSSSLSPNLLQGTVVRKGERIEYVADNLEQRIKQSTSPVTHADSTGSHHGSRRSSIRSIASASSSSTSFATSSCMSRSPSSQLQQSPDDIPPIDAGAVLELENHANRVADSLDLMMGNIRNNLHKMSAITIGCQDAYKRSVDITCDSVDGSIKTMYALMAKCEELSISMKPVDQLAAQIKEIKRILDLFESQLSDKA